MRRVVSVWFPHWPTDRLQRRHATPRDNPTPLVTALHDGRKRVLAATNPAAAAQGLRPGMAVAQAMALLPRLQILESEPEADAQALHRLALWCNALTPLAAPCPPDGIWLDMTGAAHLAGGEAPLLQSLVQRLARNGLQARAAAADTPGAAHAFAHHGPLPTSVLPPATQDQALAPLPIACLRIPPDLESTLRRLGFDQVGHLARIPRALLTRRFGSLPGLRLDQAHGHIDEPIDALPPEHPLQQHLAFLEPLLTAESFQAAIPHLVDPLCTEMERQALGARQLDLLFQRVDGHTQAIRIRTSQPSRNPTHLTRLLVERLETIDPGLGVEAMHLAASLAQPLQWQQQEEGASPPIAQLVDRLVNRLGPDAVYRTTPQESDIPERMTKRANPSHIERNPNPTKYGPAPSVGWKSPLAPSTMPPPPTENPNHYIPKATPNPPQQPHPPRPQLVPPPTNTQPTPLLTHPALRRAQRNHLRLIAQAPTPKNQHPLTQAALTQDPPILPWLPRPTPNPTPPNPTAKPWPNRLHAPARLLTPPRPIKALAALPDDPPIAFTWRRHHKIHRAEGPERIFGEWWQTEAETHAVRDYFIVEDEEGRRFWLFRRGNGLDSRTGNLEWFLHGLF